VPTAAMSVVTKAKLPHVRDGVAKFRRSGIRLRRRLALPTASLELLPPLSLRLQLLESNQCPVQPPAPHQRITPHHRAIEDISITFLAG
jgi:hypothetical protein